MAVIDVNAAPEVRRSMAVVLRRRSMHIVVLSACSLLVELVLIRWLDAQVRPLAYVKNLPLIASFLGLGIGYATPFRRRPLIPYIALLLAMTIGVGAFLASDAGRQFQTGPGGPETNIGAGSAESPVDVVKFYAIIAVLFTMTVMAMVPIGQLTAEYMHGVAALQAYTANLAGSLLGVLAAFALSAMAWPPWVNVFVAMVVFAAYMSGSRQWLILSIAAAVLAVSTMMAIDRVPGKSTVWSPYNRIEVSSLPHYRFSDGRIYVPG